MRIVQCSLVVLLGALALYQPRDGKQHISPEMRDHLIKEEGCALCTYEDSVHVNTIGVGSTKGLDNLTIPNNLRLSEEEVAKLFLRDIANDEDCLDNSLNGQAMPQSVYDGVGSVVHNIGCSGVSVNKKTKGVTQIRRAALKEDWLVTCGHITDFKYAGGKISTAIMNRRAREQIFCMRDLEGSNVGGD